MGKLLISKSGFELQEIELEHGSVCIGRAKDNQILLNDATVSSHHAKIVTVMSTSYIQDLGSTNGVFVNGKPVVVQALHAGDVISVGNHEILFQQSEANQSSEEENVYDTHLANSMAGLGSSHTRQAPVASDKAFTDFRDTINYSDLGQSNPALRVVVDNTSTPARQHTLDIDIDVDKFAKPASRHEKIPVAEKVNQVDNAQEHYIETRPYIEVASPASEVQQVVSDREPEEELFAAAEVDQQKYVEPSYQNDALVSESVQPVPAKPSATPVLHSKQPFISSEEVVEQLIIMGRNKSKRSKKSSGLSSILGVITFVLVAVAIYFQLQ
ncbi:FHA domain-containing protein [Kaarinaea lacus]